MYIKILILIILLGIAVKISRGLSLERILAVLFCFALPMVSIFILMELVFLIKCLIRF